MGRNKGENDLCLSTFMRYLHKQGAVYILL